MCPAPDPVERPRLSAVLGEHGLSGAAMKRALRSGKVSVHGVPVSDGGRVVDPATVRVDLAAPKITVGRDVAFVHHDAHLAVVWKPAGMLSVTAPSRRQETTLIGAVGRKLGKVFVVHRLDEQTSGLMLVARTEEAQEALKGALEARSITRRYLAIVDGHCRAEPWTVDSWLVRDRGDTRRGSVPEGEPVPEGAQQAVSHFRRLEVLRRRASLVEVRLESGRTHQVRIHADDSGHPVLGDPLYGGHRITRRAPRLALHAASLSLVHPVTGEPLSFQAPLADDLEILRRTLDRAADELEEREPGSSPGGGRGRSSRGGGGAKGRRSRGGKGRGGRKR